MAQTQLLLGGRLSPLKKIVYKANVEELYNFAIIHPPYDFVKPFGNAPKYLVI